MLLSVHSFLLQLKVLSRFGLVLKLCPLFMDCSTPVPKSVTGKVALCVDVALSNCWDLTLWKQTSNILFAGHIFRIISVYLSMYGYRCSFGMRMCQCVCGCNLVFYRRHDKCSSHRGGISASQSTHSQCFFCHVLSSVLVILNALTLTF